MANVKISGLTAASSALGADELEINEAGVSKKLTVTQLSTFVKADLLDDTTVNFAGTLQQGSSNVLVASNLGVSVQAYSANTAFVNALQTFTTSQRGTVTNNVASLSFDMSVTNNFKSTPTATGALTFTNIASGQSGYVLLVNTAAVAITAAATTKVGSTFLTTISTAGTYLISYWSDGTNVYCTASGALA